MSATGAETSPFGGSRCRPAFRRRCQGRFDHPARAVDVGAGLPLMLSRPVAEIPCNVEHDVDAFRHRRPQLAIVLQGRHHPRHRKPLQVGDVGRGPVHGGDAPPGFDQLFDEGAPTNPLAPVTNAVGIPPRYPNGPRPAHPWRDSAREIPLGAIPRHGPRADGSVLGPHHRVLPLDSPTREKCLFQGQDGGRRDDEL